MKREKISHCLNCNTYIGDTRYCHNCGQMNGDHHLTLLQVMKDFFGDYFTFDSKFFRSLFPLILQPGHLTREYLAGRRVSYVLPFRLYIFTTFVFFFVLALSSQFDKSRSDFLNQRQQTPRDSLQIILKNINPPLSIEAQKSVFAAIDSTFVFQYDKENAGKIIQFSEDVESAGDEGFESESDEDNGLIERYLENKAYYLDSLGSQGEQLLIKAIINQIPKVLFVLLPWFALILKMLYLRRKMYFIQHFIFSLHIHTLVFILMIPLIFFSHWILSLFLWVLFLAHLFISMKRVYDQSVWKTLLKMNALLFCYGFTLIPAAVLLVLLAMVSI